MRAVVQRVEQARVEVDGEIVGRAGTGLLVYLGAGKGDNQSSVSWMANKIRGLRVFEDATGKMSRSVEDVRGDVLVVSQFTLYGDVRKGRRPSFDKAAHPEVACSLYEGVAEALNESGLHVETGRFRAKMEVHATVAGPVTILVDSERAF